jgi:hypothetical protein
VISFNFLKTISKSLSLNLDTAKDTAAQRNVEDASTPSSSQEWSNEKRRKWIPEEEKEIKILFFQ